MKAEPSFGSTHQIQIKPRFRNMCGVYPEWEREQSGHGAELLIRVSLTIFSPAVISVRLGRNPLKCNNTATTPKKAKPHSAGTFPDK
jgi:hypothetical protein